MPKNLIFDVDRRPPSALLVRNPELIYVESSNKKDYYWFQSMHATYELSFELADVVYSRLDALINYCKENNIPLYKEGGIWSLVKKARCIFKEIEEMNSPSFNPLKSPIRRKKTYLESDVDDTDPPSIAFISYCEDILID